MLAIAFGLFTTVKSAVMGSRALQYALIGIVVVGAVLLYGLSKKKQGVAEAMAKATAAVTKRMERNREINHEIKQLPLTERADRLRQLSASR